MGWKEAINTYPSSIVYEIHVAKLHHFDAVPAAARKNYATPCGSGSRSATLINTVNN
jgi:hypothetical protein